MLILDKSKENLLVSKYGFKKEETLKLYKFGKGIVIYAPDHITRSCTIKFNSMSKELQDKLHGLIKDDVLIVAPNETKGEKIEKLKTKIRELETKIKKLEESKEI